MQQNVYDFACHACGHTWEEWDNRDPRPWYGCPRCKMMLASRLPPGASFVLMGGGVGWPSSVHNNKPFEGGKGRMAR